MKRIFYGMMTMFIVIIPFIANTQIGKKPIDLNAVKNWQSLGSADVSKNGKYYYYCITGKTGDRLLLHKMNGSRSKEIQGISSGYFTANSKTLLFNRNDSIGFISCEKTDSIHFIKGSSLKSSGKNNKYFSWFTEKNSKKELTIWSQLNNKKNVFNNIIEYIPDEDEQTILLVILDADSTYTVRLINLEKNINSKVWSGKTIPQSVKINKAHTQVAFAFKSPDNDHTNICLAKPGEFPATVNEEIVQQGDTSRHIEQLVAFSNNDRFLFFTTCPPYKKSPDPDSVHVDIWSFRDKSIPSRKKVLFDNTDGNTTECGVYDIHAKRTIYLEKELENTYTDFNYYHYDHDFTLLRINEQAPTDRQFGPDGTLTVNTLRMISLNGGSSKTVYQHQHTLNITISPDGKYILFFNLGKQRFEVYETKTGETHSIGIDIPVPLTIEQLSGRYIFNFPASSPIGWLDNGNSVLLTDTYDLWKIDLSGKKPSLCLTKGYCRKNNIRIELQIDAIANQSLIFTLKEKLIFKAIHLNDYTQQLYALTFNNNGTFTRLTGGDFNYWVTLKQNGHYLVMRNGLNDAPNYYLSSDLKQFKQLTNFQPQQKYSWYTSERVEYPLASGKMNKALLYKPDNFDSTKKYPVIFSVYENKSSELYNFHGPELSDGSIDDPAWWTSRGYLLFAPDVIHPLGNPSASGYDDLVSGAKYLQTKPWVAGNKMALVGVSHGAFMINLLITKCHLFAAAAPGAGIVNWISGYGSLRNSGLDRSYLYETDQSKAGVSLWENKQMYLDNSSILNADSVQTPLLILHNKEDGAVPFEQGLSWFLAMRRLGKPAWILQYDGEGHGVREEKNMVDYTLRLEEFLNHYLKETPAPDWMK
jgi:dienelactone hydrolase